MKSYECVAPKDDAFDGRAYYAGRTFSLNGRRILFGWVPTKECEDDNKNFEWAGTFVAHEVYQREDGSLGVKIPNTVWDAFQDGDAKSFELDTEGKRSEVVISDRTGDIFSFEADLEFEEWTTSSGL